MSGSGACERQAFQASSRRAKEEQRDLRSHAAIFVKEAIFVLKIFRASDAVCSSFESQMFPHLVKADYGHYLSQAKSFCCYGRAVILRDELPPFSLEFSGRFRRWFRRRCNEMCPENRHLMNSLWNLKNTAEGLPRSCVKKLLEQHADGIDEKFDVSSWEVVNFLNVMEPILDKVAVEAAEIFGARKHELYTIPGSNKSSIESNSLSGGEVGSLIRDAFPFGSIVTPHFELGHPQRRHYDVELLDYNRGIRFHQELFAQYCKRLDLKPGSKKAQQWWDSASHHWYGEAPEYGYVPVDGCKVGAPTTRVPSVVNTTCLGKRWVAGFDDVAYHFSGLGAIVIPELDEFLEWVESPCDPTLSCLPFYVQDSPSGAVVMEASQSTCPSNYDYKLWWTESREDPVYYGTIREVDLVGGSYEDEPVEGCPLSMQVWRDYVDEIIGECESLPYHRWGEFRFEEFDHPWMRRKVVGVCEPLKLRVITVGPARQKYIGRIWQMCVHGALKTIPGFELLGRPAGCGDIKEVSRGVDGVDCFSSSDFKGASNHTPMRLNIALCEMVSRLLPDWLQAYALNSCQPHFLEYSLELCAWQFTGTLMGELTSFPLLSLLVMGCLAVTAKEEGVKLSVQAVCSRARCNGDDLVFRSTWGFAEQFWVRTRRYGFDKSVGKSYEHEHYANINSMNFWVDSSGDVSRERGLFCGLLAGKKKLATDIFDPGTVVSELLGSCYDGKMEHNVMKLFLQRHGPALRWSCGGRNLFVPCYLGGMGQIPPRDWVDRNGFRHVWKNETSSTQRKVAKHMLDADPYIRFGQVISKAPSRGPLAGHPWDVEGQSTYWDSMRKAQAEWFGTGPSPLNIKEYCELHEEVDWDSAPEMRIGPTYRSLVRRPGTLPTAPTVWTCRVCGEPGQTGDTCAVCLLFAEETIKLSKQGVGFGPLPELRSDVDDIEIFAPILDAVVASQVCLRGYNAPPRFNMLIMACGNRIRPRL